MGFRDVETGKSWIFKIEYSEEPYGQQLEQIRELLSQCKMLIGFNLKYDLHWLRRYGINLPEGLRVFDCQNAWFILTNQLNRYPSLDQVAEYYHEEKKIDVVKIEYWDRGLDTDEVPYNILCEYLEQDLVVTANVFWRLLEDIANSSSEMKKLISVSMQDLLVLEDIEWNGLLYNMEKSIRKGNELQRKIEEIDNGLRGVFEAPWFNPNSGDHLSACLYGGTIYVDGKEDYLFTYKDGRQATKSRKVKLPIICRGIFKPIQGTELAKAGFFSTDADTLKTLAETATGEAEKIIQLLLTRSKLEKQRSTYFHGFPKKAIEFNWEDQILHSSFNQCVAVSGRLSSNKPNVQNLETDVKECIESRFKLGENNG
jgi:DNA polymerase I-like protein with 3'-5' exonuclease and polymerase domains